MTLNFNTQGMRGWGGNELFSHGNLISPHLAIPLFKLAKILKFLDLEQKLCVILKQLIRSAQILSKLINLKTFADMKSGIPNYDFTNLKTCGPLGEKCSFFSFEI